MTKLYSIIVTLLLGISSLSLAQETIVLQDALQGSSSAGTQYGGSFTSDGYRPGNGTNHILYDVPVQIPNGYIEFQVKGFNFNDFPPVTVDAQSHESAFIALYDGRGIPEPIVYSLDYRNNYFRWELIYRSERYGYVGAGNRFKAKIHCAADTPARLNSTYAVYPYVPENTADWGTEPNGIYTYWDPNTWYTIKVEWNNTTKDFRAYRNGVVVWDSELENGVPVTDNGVYPITSPYPWLPVDFKFWLGSGPGRYDNEVPGTTYRNLKVVSLGAVQNLAPVITSSAVTNGTVGQLYAYDVNATGNPTPSYSLVTFPSGMTINSSTGLIQWTPSSTGNFNVTAKAANGVSPDATQSFTINVQSNNTFAPIITSTPITTGLIGQLYSYDVETDANPNVTYSLTTFPPGMTINSTSGLIQWTPSTSGNVNVTVKAANGVSPDATQSFTINVQSTNTAPIITSTAVTNGIVGQLYSYDVNATGNPAPTYSLTVFPSGMSINSSTGLIQWTPSSTGNFNVTVKAANGISPDAAQSFQINVTEAPPCPTGILSYWKLDETSGSTYLDYVGSNNASSTNTPTPSTGRVNGGQTFNGTTNRITAPRIAAYDFGASSSFTFEAWVNRTSGSYITEEIVVERKGSSGGLIVSLKFNYTRAISFAVRNTSWQSFTATGTTVLYDGNWHHVVGVKDGSTNQLRVYVDGVLEATVAAVYGAGFDSPTDGISIGWRSSSSEGFFKGMIDEVAVYNSALDAASIQQHYNNGLQNKGYCSDQTPGTAPVITSTAVTDGTVGQLYSYDVNATGSPTPAYSLTVFPSGMTINSTSGLIQWTPSASGNVNVTVKASNGVNPDATQSFTINVQDNQTSTCPPSMISYWKLDETSGSTYVDYVGSNNASSTNTPTPSTGRVNGGQTFNGTTNRITAPRIAAYDFGASSSFTFEAWINHPTGTFADQDEIIVGRKAADSKLSVWLGFGVSSSVSFGVRSKTGEAKTVTGGPDLFDGSWHHVVGVKDGSTNQLRIYVDGVLGGTIAATYTSGFDSPTATMDIGWRNISWETAFFKGMIDEVAVYNSALDAASIQQHYNNGLQNKGYCENQVLLSKNSQMNYVNVFSTIENHINGNTVQLKWASNSDLTSGRFEIERSTNSLGFSKQWQKIGELIALNNIETKEFTFSDNPNTSGKISYRIKYIDDGKEIFSKQIEMELMPEEFVLSQNYPNPFNPATKIKFSVPVYSKVTLDIYNQLGELIAQHVNSYFEAGTYEIEVNLNSLASGVYFYRMSAGEFTNIKKMILAK